MPNTKSVLFRDTHVVTMDSERRVLERADVWVRGNQIAAIGPALQVPPMTQVIDARGCALIPGLIQTHVHLCQALFRGMADELPLMRWLRERIWPLEAAHDARSMKASAALGLAEMIRSGTTTILDMGSVHHQDAVFRAMKASGIRGFSGKAMMDAGQGVPRGLRESRTHSLKESLRLADRWHGHDRGRLGYAFAPRFILSCSERLLRETAEAAQSRDLIVHSHAAEHPNEKQEVRKILGADDVDVLKSWGLFGPRTILAHGVQLTKRQMKDMAHCGTRVVHCPSANLKLASGIADVVGMHNAGMTVGIGADGAPCNNRLDAWTQMREAALLAKVKRKDASALAASKVLEMATIDGAKVLGIEDQVGSIEVGKKADLTLVDIESEHHLPGGSPISRLVYAAQSHDVHTVMIDGQLRVHQRKLVTVNSERIRQSARREAKKLLTRAKLK